MSAERPQVRVRSKGAETGIFKCPAVLCTDGVHCDPDTDHHDLETHKTDRADKPADCMQQPMVWQQFRFVFLLELEDRFDIALRRIGGRAERSDVLVWFPAQIS